MFRIVLFTVSLGAGTLAAMLAAGSLSSRDSVASSAVTVETDQILIAAREVQQGDTLDSDDFRWQSWPREALMAGAIRRSRDPEAAKKLEGSIARSRFVIGEVVLPEKIAPAGTGFLSAMLESGKRAVAVSVSAESSAGGFVRPGDKVDVLHTTTCQPHEGCPTGNAVRTILTNVRVLAIDQVGTRSDSETVSVGKTATVELDPAQAEIIIGAEAAGTLTLVLRPAESAADAEPARRTTNRLMRVHRAGVVEYVTIN